MKRREYGSVMRLVSFLLCLCLLATGCKNVPGETTPPETTGAEMEMFTVQVVNQGGNPVDGVGVYVYTDETCADLVWFDKTNSEGKVSFSGTAGSSYVAVLSDVGASYLAEESYPITSAETVITLADGVLTDENMDSITYKLGDTMLDFSVTAPDGTVYTLSQLLKEKDAVVLNFWYENCGPCAAEFPYLQEAYAQNSKIAVLALNPVDGNDASIAAYQQQHELTFPMAKCDAVWESMMQITGYPTTVVVDRNGIISLIHTGAVPDTKTFADAFTFFTADDYVPTLVENIADLAIPEEPVGTAENPLEFGGVTFFEVTVEPGQEVHCNVYKAFNVYMSIQDKDAYVIYNNKTYKPSSGVVGATVSCEDTYTPAKLVIGNSGTETKTFTVILGQRSGSINNPITLKLGEFSTKCPSGNDQGVNYLYKATEDGTFTVTCLSATSGVDYDYFLYNLDSYAYRSMQQEGSVDENGNPTISVAVKKGQSVRVTLGAMPNASNNYPAVNFTSLAAFTARDGSETEEDAQKIAYTLSVQDIANGPMANVYIKLTGTDVEQTLVTGEDGKVTVELVPGEYTAVVTVPAGFRTACDQLQLTETTVEGVFLLEEEVINTADYQVTVLDPLGQPVANAMVLIGSQMAYTDAEGKASITLDVANYTVYVSGLSADLATGSASYTFHEGETALTVNLIYKPGTENNPVKITTVPFTTDRMSAGASAYYTVSGADGKTLTIADADATVTYSGTVYTAEDGIVTVPLTSDEATLLITNGGSSREAYTVDITEATEPSEPEETEPTEPEETEPSEPEETEPTEPEETEPTEPEETEPPEPEETEPTEPEETEPTEPEETEPTEPEETEPTEPEETEPTQPEETEPTEPEETEPTEPEETEPTEPEETEPTEPEETEPTEPEETEPTEPEETEPTEPEETEPTEPEETEPTEPSTEPTTPPTEPPTEPTEPEITYGDYTVKVTDYEGAPAANVLVVIFDENGAIAANGMTDGSGEFVTELDYANYTVQLAGTTWYYEKSTVVLSSTKTELTILLASELTGETESMYLADSEAAYRVYLGGTHVTLGTSGGSYSTENGMNYFVFIPDEAGIYRFTTSNPDAKISYWGSNPFFFNEQPYVIEADNSFTQVIQKANLGGAWFIGVTGTADVTECALVITRLGDPTFDPNYVEPTVYQGTTTPKKYTFRGGALTYVDIFGDSADYKLVYNQTDGYYHLGTANGPVVMVHLGVGAPYVSFDMMINGDGIAGGTAFKAAFYDSYGNYVVEDYTDLMMKYIDCMDANKGLYPLTKDLAYMLQNGAAYRGWTDSTGPSYLFKDADGNPMPGVNEEIAWMFACCYVK